MTQFDYYVVRGKAKVYRVDRDTRELWCFYMNSGLPEDLQMTWIPLERGDGSRSKYSAERLPDFIKI